jgi:hypothetical protein
VSSIVCCIPEQNWRNLYHEYECSSCISSYAQHIHITHEQTQQKFLLTSTAIWVEHRNVLLNWPLNFRNEDQPNAQFFTSLLRFILYFPSNMFRQAAIFREECIMRTKRNKLVKNCPFSWSSFLKLILMHGDEQYNGLWISIFYLLAPNSGNCQSEWPPRLRRRSAVVRLLGLWVRIPPGAWISVSCECCVLSGRGLRVGPITRPEESYRVWCVWMWTWSPDNEEALAH